MQLEKYFKNKVGTFLKIGNFLGFVLKHFNLNGRSMDGTDSTGFCGPFIKVFFFKKVDRGRQN